MVLNGDIIHGIFIHEVIGRDNYPKYNIRQIFWQVKMIICHITNFSSIYKSQACFLFVCFLFFWLEIDMKSSWDLIAIEHKNLG